MFYIIISSVIFLVLYYFYHSLPFLYYFPFFNLSLTCLTFVIWWLFGGYLVVIWLLFGCYLVDYSLTGLWVVLGTLGGASRVVSNVL